METLWRMPFFRQVRSQIAQKMEAAASAAVTTGLERHAALALYQSPGGNDFGARQKRSKSSWSVIQDKSGASESEAD